MRRAVQRGVAALACLCAAAVSVYAGEPDGRTIMEKNYFAGKLTTSETTARMVLLNDRGETRERTIKITGRLQRNGTDSDLVIRFLYPPDIRGTGFLQIEHSDTDDSLWVYLPSLKKSRRLVANNKKDRFFGSDFFYGDIIPPKVDSYRHTLLRSELIDGHDCYVVESVPKSDGEKESSGYGKKITWVRKDSFLEARVEYYDEDGNLFKTQRAMEHKLVEPGKERWIALRREMKDLRANHVTRIEIDDVKAGMPVSGALFTVKALERE
jgi:outer membrane lipoprotein-sorting protein